MEQVFAHDFAGLNGNDAALTVSDAAGHARGGQQDYEDGDDDFPVTLQN